MSLNWATLPSSRPALTSPHRILYTAAVLSLLFVPALAVIIDFEDIETTGPGTGGQTAISEQYRDRGVTFNRPVAIDYSLDLSISGFAHSPTRGVESCYSREFCQTPVEMRFDAPVNYLRLWVGHRGSLRIPRTVSLWAYDLSGALVGSDQKTVGPSPSHIPISIPLEVTTESGLISRAKVSYVPDQNGLVDNGGLAIDDVEFEVNQMPTVRLMASPGSSPLTVGSTVTFEAQASDPEGDPLQFRFFLDGRQVREISRDSSWSWRPGQEEGGDHRVTVEVTDGRQSSSDSLAISVLANRPPSIHSIRMDPESPQAESPVTFTVQASDPEGDPLQFTFLLDQELVRDWSAENIWTWTPSGGDAADHLLEVRVSDAQDGDRYSSATRTVSVQPIASPEPATVEVTPENRPPPFDPRPWIVGGAVAAAILAGAIWRIIRTPPGSSPPRTTTEEPSPPEPSLPQPTFKAHGDVGLARVDPEEALDVTAELRLLVVADPGVQQTEEGSPQIVEEEVER